MKLGFMIYSLSRSLADGTLTVPGALALMKECGVEGVDITDGHVTGYTAAEVRKMAEDAGIAISAWIGGGNLATSDPEIRKASLDTIRALIDKSAEAGTRNLLVTTGGCAADQDKAEGRRNVAAGLAEVLPVAKAAGIVLSIEDFGSPVAPYQNSAECMETCELAGPDLMMTYDSGNMVMADEDPVEFLLAVKSRLAHAHAKDWELLPPDAERGLTSRAGKKYIGTVVGTGVLDYPAIIKTLKGLNYTGYLSFEYEGRGDPVQAARDGMAYLRDLVVD